MTKVVFLIKSGTTLNSAIADEKNNKGIETTQTKNQLQKVILHLLTPYHLCFLIFINKNY